MSFSHRVTEGYSTSEGTVISKTTTVTDEAELRYDDTVSAETSDVATNVSFPFAGVKAVCLSSDQSVTIKTNSSTVPADTINLVGGTPKIWYTGGPGTNPFTVNVSQMFLSNAGLVAANVKIRVLLHVTTP